MSQCNLGGITLKEVITFQTQIMLGAQFGRISREETTEKDLMIACLRMGWNDAFRHTSKNKKTGKLAILVEKELEWRKDHKAPYDDYICGEILGQETVLNAFAAFYSARSTESKVQAIEKHYPALEALIGQYKETGGDKALCFGHFQKMFNIAVKLYACLYVCRQELDLNERLFCSEILENLQNADCPIDSIILKKLAIQTENKEYADHKWSKYGTTEHPQSNYQKVQGEISKAVPDGKSRLYYDFIAWKQ